MTLPPETSSRRPIAIIGLGGCFPDAPDVATYWRNICAGHVAIREVPEGRWESELWYSADRSAADMTYSKIGGFIDEFPFDRKQFRIPPRTLGAIDDVQKMALTAVAEALADAGLEVMPGKAGAATAGRKFARDRTAVILGNAMGGENEDLTSLRVWYPKARVALESSAAFRALPEQQRQAMLEQMESSYKERLPPVTEDSMPGELSNCITGRIANLFDLRGPNFTTDAACAASMAAIATAARGLVAGEYDLAIAGGVDRSMDPPTYVKFAKIGALSAERSAPFDGRANGFVMGEGAGIVILKRLEDARRDGDRVYAVIRGIGAASDGRGKGMTAPNPRGQRLAVERAYADAGFSIDSIGYFEAHGTSTVVGDSTELTVLTDLVRETGVPAAGIPIGSVKSMIGHLKSAAGSAAMIKMALAIYHKVVPPSAGFESAAADSPLHQSYLRVPTRTEDWGDSPRRGGVSAFGFGGTNFHIVLSDDAEQELPLAQGSQSSSLSRGGTASMAAAANAPLSPPVQRPTVATTPVSTLSMDTLLNELTALFAQETGYEVDELEADFELEADLGIDTIKQAEVLSAIRERYTLPPDDEFKLSDTPTLRSIAAYVAAQLSGAGTPEATAAQPQAAIDAPTPPLSGPVLVAFGGATRENLFATARSRAAAATELGALACGVVDLSAEVWRLTFVARSVDEARKKIEDADGGKPRRLLARGIFLSDAAPVSGSVGVAFLFPGQGSQYIGMLKGLADKYAVVRETFAEADQILEPLIGGRLSEIVWPALDADASTEEKAAADKLLRQTEHCQPAMLTADVAMLRLLRQFGLTPHSVAGHSLGEYGACVAASVLSFADALYAVSARGREMAHVKVEDNGKMMTVAAGADRVEEVLADVSGYVIAANKNCHAQTVVGGASIAVDDAMARFTALNIEARPIPVSHAFHSQIVAAAKEPLRRVLTGLTIGEPQLELLSNVTAAPYPRTKVDIVDVMARQIESPVEFIRQVERLHDDGARVFIEVGPRRAITGFVRNILDGREHIAVATNHHKKAAEDALLEALAALAASGIPFDLAGGHGVPEPALVPASGSLAAVADAVPSAADQPGSEAAALGEVPVVITGLSAILPGGDPLPAIEGDPYARLLAGENFIESLNDEQRQEILDKNLRRLNKTTGEFEPMRELGDVIQLAARLTDFDLAATYGLEAGFADALDVTSTLAIAAGIEALRDAGLPLQRRYRTTRSGKKLADRWALPAAVGERTGVICASAFPNIDRIIEDVAAHVASAYAARSLRDLDRLYSQLTALIDEPEKRAEIQALFDSQRETLKSEAEHYTFNRKFLFRILSMGHAQLAQTIVAQGPNTQVNAACASGPMAVALAQDWIRLGRCDRVVVVSVDNVTTDTTLPYIAAGFLAAGAAGVGARVEDVAVPFGTQRDGMLIGAGASGFVVEKAALAAARGLRPLGEVIYGSYENSAFHGTRLDVDHISGAFSRFVDVVGARLGRSRAELAASAFFVSHETYTPARGGSSAAEIEAIRRTFTDQAGELLIANTKGYTGHPMAATIEDVVALKGLQRRQVPAIAHMGPNKEGIDPAFADLNFADGAPLADGVDIAIRFAAGFGSQLCLIGYKRAATSEGRLYDVDRYRRWLSEISGVDGEGGRGEPPGLEVVFRTLRIAEEEGVDVLSLGVPSLALESDSAVQPAETPVHVPSTATVPVQISAGAMVPAQVGGDLLQEVIALFAEHTGYEPEEFDPNYDLEADLGIDTVKQAEIFSLLRDRYGFPMDDSFKLAEVATLAAVVDYVRRSAPGVDSGQAPASQVPATQAPATQAPGPQVAAVVVVSTPVETAMGTPELLAEIRAMFAEETGYDLEELAADDELEADLGIDTVKQAEIFTRLRQTYHLPTDDNFKLSDVATLRKASDYVAGQMGGAAAVVPVPSLTPTEAEENGSTVAPEVPPPSPQAAAARKVEQDPAGSDMLNALTDLFAAETGYDVDELAPDDELEADLGIDTVKQAEIISLIRERYALARDDNFKLSDLPTLRAVANYVAETAGSGAVAEPSSPAEADETPIGAADSVGEYAKFGPRPVVLTPLPTASGADLGWYSGKRLTVFQPSTADADEVRLAASLVSALRQQGAEVEPLGQQGEIATGLDGFIVVGRNVEETLLFAKSIADHGAHAAVLLVGYARGQPFAGESGASVGLAKSLSKEWPGMVSLSVELERSTLVDSDALRVLGEWRQAATAGVYHEVVLAGGQRSTLAQGEVLVPAVVPLTDKAVVVATGGADGITYVVLHELAVRQRDLGRTLQFVLIGRTVPASAAESPLSGDKDADKALARQSLGADPEEKVTPRAVRQFIERWQRRVQLGDNLQALRALGSTVEFVQADVADGEALRAALAPVVASHRVDVVVHGAGLEDSRLLADKDTLVLQATVRTKSQAAKVLYEVLHPRRFVNMGSVAGRYGNAAQVDYAAANGALAGFSRSWSNTLTIAWTAWSEVGMATRGSVAKVLEQGGVEFLPPRVGAQIGADLLMSSICGEVLVAGGLGAFAPQGPGSGEDLPIVDSDAVQVLPREVPEVAQTESVRPFHSEESMAESTRFSFRLGLDTVPGLDDHRIGGIAVLPGVVGIELMAQAALARLGRAPLGMRDVELASPVKVFRDESLALEIEAFDDGRVTLASLFRTKQGRLRRREHFSATVVTEIDAEQEQRPPLALEMPRDPKISSDAIYRRYFHGPNFQVINRVLLLGEDGIAICPAPTTQPWIAGLNKEELLTSPFLREAGFQAAGLWEMTELGCMALPSGIRRLTLSGALGSLVPEATTVDVRRRSATGRSSEFDIWVRDAAGTVVHAMHGYRTALLRDLEASERFEPAPPSCPAPDLVRVDVAEIEAMLAENPQRTAERFLSPAEQKVFAEFKHSKRRCEWLAGRIAAKRLIREARFCDEGAIVSYAAISILADDLGAPSVAVVGEPTLSPVISISHSAGLAVAMGLPSSTPAQPEEQTAEPSEGPVQAVRAIGVDIEAIESRSRRFVEDYFTAEEVAAMDALAAGDAAKLDFQVTARWALKEALLKAIGIGARVDMRALTTLYRPASSSSEDAQAIGGEGWFVWQPGVHETDGIAATLSSIEHRGQPLVLARVYRSWVAQVEVSQGSNSNTEASY